MAFMVHFQVEGIPIGKGRPRFRRTKNFVQTYTDSKTAAWEETIKTVAKSAMGDTPPLESPVSVFVYFGLPVPSSYSKKRTTACLEGREAPSKKPDLDNMAKAVLDAMNGVVFKDDSQIINLHLKKVYSIEVGVNVLVKEEVL
jgi:Holliday junction resolvase RusA-like endonuclease